MTVPAGTSRRRRFLKQPVKTVLFLLLSAVLLLSACSGAGTASESESYREAGVTVPISPTEQPTTEVHTEPDPDPALDVLNHYANLFIASKVNTYLNLRDAPSTQGTIIGKITKNAGGEILEDLGAWYHIRSGGIEGYVASEYCISGAEARALAPSVAVPKVHVTAKRLNVRTGPGLEYGVWTQLGTSDYLSVEEDLGAWYKVMINNTDGYISKDFAEAGWYLQEAMPWTSWSGISEKRQKLLQYAEQFIGIPYELGGTSLEGEGIDCSSFVQQCLKNAIGISLDRTSRQLAARGTEVTLSEAKPGDLLFYTDQDGIINHVAFYMGDGKILHASRSFGQVAVSAYNYASEPSLIKNVIGD